MSDYGAVAIVCVHVRVTPRLYVNKEIEVRVCVTRRGFILALSAALKVNFCRQPANFRFLLRPLLFCLSFPRLLTLCERASPPTTSQRCIYTPDAEKLTRQAMYFI